jgi:hypothetical protein
MIPNINSGASPVGFATWRTYDGIHASCNP